MRKLAYYGNNSEFVVPIRLQNYLPSGRKFKVFPFIIREFCPIIIIGTILVGIYDGSV